VCLGVAGCSAPRPDLPSDVTWRSAHFTYHTRTGDAAVCEGILADLERHFGVLQNRLGFPWESGRRIDYYHFLDASDFDANAHCDPGAAGCLVDGGIRTADRFDEHELIHAYLADIGRPTPLIEEGTAVSFACGIGPTAPPRLSWRRAMEDPSSLDLYAAGGWLVGHLVDRYGTAPLMQLYARLSPDTDADGLARTFSDIYGTSLDAEWDAISIADGVRTACASVWPCTGEALAVGTDLSLESGCGANVVARTFSLDVAASLRWETGGPWNAQIGECGTAASPHGAALRSATGGRFRGLVELDAGDYFLLLRPPATLAWSAAPSTWVGDTCDGLEPMTLTIAAQTSVEVDVRRGGATRYARLQIDGATGVAMRLAEAAGGAGAEVCDSCSAAPGSCETLTADATALRRSTGEQILRWGPRSDDDGFATIRLAP